MILTSFPPSPSCLKVKRVKKGDMLEGEAMLSVIAILLRLNTDSRKIARRRVGDAVSFVAPRRSY